MGTKRKKSETTSTPSELSEEAPARPNRTLLGWKSPLEAVINEKGPLVFRNKEKVLVLCSRRIAYRYRHLMMDIVSLLPHCKKDNKVESKENKGATLNELVELRNCSSCLFFECRKQKDLYLWMAKCPSGPSVKFLANAVHTMEELKLTGNHLKGSRPILTFSSDFDLQPHWQLLKEIMTQIFCTPKDHRKTKPFFWSCVCFFYCRQSLLVSQLPGICSTPWNWENWTRWFGQNDSHWGWSEILLESD